MKIEQIVLLLLKGWRISRNKGAHETVFFDDILFLLFMEFATMACKPSIKVMTIIPYARLELALYIQRMFFQTKVEMSHHHIVDSQSVAKGQFASRYKIFRANIVATSTGEYNSA